MTTDRVTVVMPAWNAERFIEDALRSILDQTTAPAAIVVVDDGSTDATARIAGSVDSSITVLRRAHAGIGAARTAGIGATASELVAFLDADDLWLPDKIERQLAMLDADRTTEAVFCLVDEFYDLASPPPAGVRRPRQSVAAALPSTALVRRDLVVRLGPFSTSPVGEWVGWWAQARAQQVREGLVPRVLVRRRLHASNNSNVCDDHGRTLLAVARAHSHAMRERGDLG